MTMCHKLSNQSMDFIGLLNWCKITRGFILSSRRSNGSNILLQVLHNLSHLVAILANGWWDLIGSATSCVQICEVYFPRCTNTVRIFLPLLVHGIHVIWRSAICKAFLCRKSSDHIFADWISISLMLYLKG